MLRRKIFERFFSSENVVCTRIATTCSTPIPAPSFSILFILGGISIVLQLFTKFFQSGLVLLLFMGTEAIAQGMRSIDGCSIRRGTLCSDANLYGADLQNAN